MHGDDIAEDRALVERIAREVIAEFGGRSEKEDLVQSGFEGLLQARARYDANGVTPFPAWAYRRIRGAMIDMLRKRQLLTRRALERCERAAKLEAMLEAETENAAKDPPKGDLAATQAIAALMAKYTAGYVADVAASVERHGTEEGLVTQLDLAKVDEAVALLPAPQQKLVRAVFWEERRLAEIGAAERKSESWASRELSKALAALAEMLS